MTVKHIVSPVFHGTVSSVRPDTLSVMSAYPRREAMLKSIVVPFMGTGGARMGASPRLSGMPCDAASHGVGVDRRQSSTHRYIISQMYTVCLPLPYPLHTSVC